MKKRVAALTLAAALLAGCTGADGEIPDRGEVLALSLIHISPAP